MTADGFAQNAAEQFAIEYRRAEALSAEVKQAAKLIDALISAWYGPQPFAWPEMLPSKLVERVAEFQLAHSADTWRWLDEEEQDDE